MSSLKKIFTWRMMVLLLVVIIPGLRAVAADSLFESSLGDYREELESARAQGKTGVLLMLEKNGCPFCARMKETVLNRPEVVRFFKQHFLCFGIDMDDSTAITDFQGKPASHQSMSAGFNPLGTTPVFVYVDMEGKVPVRYIGASSGAREFLWWGEYIVRRHYLKTNFTRYKKMMKLEKGQ